MSIVVKLQNFYNASPTIFILAVVIFICAFGFLRETAWNAIKYALMWIGLNFVCTTIFGVALPTIPQILQWLADFAKTILP